MISGSRRGANSFGGGLNGKPARSSGAAVWSDSALLAPSESSRSRVSSVPSLRSSAARFVFEGVRRSGTYALADTLAGLPRRIRVGYADKLEDVDDGDAYHRLKPRRGF